MTFTTNEIDLLMKGLDALVAEFFHEKFAILTIGAILSSEAEKFSEFVENQQEDFTEGEKERELLSERVILIKAKLIRMKDEAMAQEIADSVRGKSFDEGDSVK
jgi:hypothetical protein